LQEEPRRHPCFYRAVGIQYFELLCSPCIEVSEFEAFIKKLFKKEKLIQDLDEFRIYRWTAS
jgi:hypothetical protein